VSDAEREEEELRRLQANAERARRLASQMTHDSDRQMLEKHADELERRALQAAKAEHEKEK
jgi:hypothetical protein